MDASHVVMQIPAPWKAFDGSIASGIMATMGIPAVEMHSMSLSLMTEETGIGRKFELSTVRMLALVGLQVRIQIFAACISWAATILERTPLTHNHIFAWWEDGHKVFLRQTDI